MKELKSRNKIAAINNKSDIHTILVLITLDFLLLVIPDLEATPITHKTIVILIFIRKIFKTKNAVDSTTGV